MPEKFIIHDHIEFGELPCEDEQRYRPELDALLQTAGLRLVQAYNEQSGYYLVEYVGEQ